MIATFEPLGGNDIPRPFKPDPLRPIAGIWARIHVTSPWREPFPTLWMPVCNYEAQSYLGHGWGWTLDTARCTARELRKVARLLAERRDEDAKALLAGFLFTDRSYAIGTLFIATVHDFDKGRSFVVGKIAA